MPNEAWIWNEENCCRWTENTWDGHEENCPYHKKQGKIMKFLTELTEFQFWVLVIAGLFSAFILLVTVLRAFMVPS